MMTHISRVLREETFYRKKNDKKPCEPGYVEAEAHKCVVRTSLAGRLTTKGDLGMDFGACTCAMAKMCMLPDQHREFVGYGLDSSVLRAAESKLFSALASQVMNPHSVITENGEMRAPTRRFKKKVAMVSACGRAAVWESARGLDSTQVMPNHISLFCCTTYENRGLYQKCGHILLGMWSLV